MDPLELEKKFANILRDELVATKVKLVVRLHRALEFRNEDFASIKNDGTLFEKDVGNATVKTRVTFEYQAKSKEQIEKLGIDLNQIKEVPFQAQIHYTSLEGHKFMRVVTKKQSTTTELKHAEKHLNPKVIHKRVAQQSANYLHEGRF